MEDQGTVLGTAAQQLKPIQNNNIGAIVQENIRYWNQVNTQKEAARKAAAAREREFKRKQKESSDKRFDDYVGNLATDESQGYFNNQSVKLLGLTNEVILRNYDKARNGTYEERIAALQENDLWRNKTLAFSKFNTASNDIAKNLDPNNYNAALDYETKKLGESILTGNYRINEEGNLDLTNPLNGEDIKVDPSELLATIKSMKYSGKIELSTLAETEMKSIIQKVDNGEIKISDVNKQTGLNRAINVLSDERVFRDFAYKTDFAGMKKDPTVYKNFTDEQKTELAEDFYELYFETQFKQVNNSLERRNTESQISNREEKEITNRSTIAQATDNGQPVVLKPEVYSRISGVTASGELVETKNVNGELAVYNALDEKGETIIIGGKAGSKFSYEVTGFVENKKTKKIGLIGFQVESVPDGEPVPTGKGKETKQYYIDVKTQAINFNPTDVNQAASSQTGTIIRDGKEVFIKAKNEDELRSIINNIKSIKAGGAAFFNNTLPNN
jgi:hypothetical protein